MSIYFPCTSEYDLKVTIMGRKSARKDNLCGLKSKCTGKKQQPLKYHKTATEKGGTL